MSLRYGRLFDSTVRTEYERALTAAKAHLGALPADPPHGRTPLPIVDGDWKHAPAVKARLAGGFCIRTQVQGPCAYANICEHGPNFRTDTGYLPVLAAQRADTETLARDKARGWTGEAERRLRSAQGVLAFRKTVGDPRLEAACARAIAVGDPSYRTIKGILAAGTELDGLTEPAAPQAPAHLRGPEAFDTNTGETA